MTDTPIFDPVVRDADPRAWGADPTSPDNRLPIQACADAVRDGGGGTVALPDAPFRVVPDFAAGKGHGVALGAGVALVGGGPSSRLVTPPHPATGGGCCVVLIAANVGEVVSGVRVENLAIESQGTTYDPNWTGLGAFNASGPGRITGLVVRGVRVTAPTRSGIVVAALGGIDNWRVEDCDVESVEEGIYLAGYPSDGVIRSCRLDGRFGGVGSLAIGMRNAVDVLAEENVIRGQWQHSGICVRADNGLSKRVTIRRNRLNVPDKSAISVQEGEDVRVVGNTVAHAGGNGIEVWAYRPITGCLVAGNDILRTSRSGYAISAAAQAAPLSGLRVLANYARGCQQGLTVDGVTTGEILGNDVEAWGGPGLYILNGGPGLTVDGNRARGWAGPDVGNYSEIDPACTVGTNDLYDPA